MSHPIAWMNLAAELKEWGEQVEVMRRRQALRDYKAMRKLGYYSRYTKPAHPTRSPQERNE